MLVQRFYNNYSQRPGPPIRLKEWLVAVANNKYLKDHRDDNLPEKKAVE